MMKRSSMALTPEHIRTLHRFPRGARFRVATAFAGGAGATQKLAGPAGTDTGEPEPDWIGRTLAGSAVEPTCEDIGEQARVDVPAGHDRNGPLTRWYLLTP